VAAARQWGFPTLYAFRNRSHFLIGQPMNLGSRASYMHDSRGPLPTDLVSTPLIKALRGVDGDLISNQSSYLVATPSIKALGAGGGGLMGT
jgi:hypothetical protein